MTPSRSAAILFALALVGGPSFDEASAQPTPLVLGVRALDRGELRRAAAHLEDATRAASPGPERARAFLYLGLAQLRLRDLDAARRSFAAALLDDPNATPDPRRTSPEARAEIDAMRGMVMGELEVDAGEPGARVLVDGTERGVSPLTLKLPAGPHQVRVVSRDGDRFFEQSALDVGGGQRVTVRPTLQLTPEAIARIARESERKALEAQRIAAAERAAAERARLAREAVERRAREAREAEVRRIEAQRQAEARRRAAEVERRRAAHEAQRNKRRKWRRAGYALLGSGVALGVTSGVLTYLSARQNTLIQAGGLATANAIADAAATGVTYNRAALALGIMGGVALAAGLPLILANRDLGDFRVTAAPLPGGGALLVAFSLR